MNGSVLLLQKIQLQSSFCVKQRSFCTSFVYIYIYIGMLNMRVNGAGIIIKPLDYFVMVISLYDFEWGKMGRVI